MPAYDTADMVFDLQEEKIPEPPKNMRGDLDSDDEDDMEDGANGDGGPSTSGAGGPVAGNPEGGRGGRGAGGRGAGGRGAGGRGGDAGGDHKRKREDAVEKEKARRAPPRRSCPHPA